MEKSIKQLFTYLIVGGIATVVEWVAFFALNTGMTIHYAPATALAFVISTFANWAAGRLLMFEGDGHIWAELAKIYLTSIAGLLMNLLIMWVAIDCVGLGNNISKIIATGLVFGWNFIIRKLVIYKV